MTTIRAEIRKWRRNTMAVTGKIYKDTQEVWDDGEEVTFIGVKNITQHPTFLLVETTSGIFKLELEEELK